jgi:hypothetical protein
METKHIKSFGTIIILGIVTIIVAIVITTLREPVVMDQVLGIDPLAEQPAVISVGNITIDNLVQNQVITTPMTITGTVKVWFFEGSFPVFVKDSNGNQLAVALASSPVDWMTADPIPFTVTIPAINYQGPGTITFQKDNPSGEPQFDEQVVVNVVFE